MELPKLDLVDEVMRAKVLDVLKPLDIDEIKCKKLMTVFDEELDKGKQLKKIILLEFLFLQVWSQVSQAQAYKWRTLLFQNF